MTRAELRQRFRDENPDVTDRVITDVTLNSWMKTCNLEVCSETRCIVTNVAETFNTTSGLQYYDLESLIDNFLDIDEMPGGGVFYNNVHLEKTSQAELSIKKPKWRDAESGTPKKWWMRGKYLWFDVPPDAAEDVDIDCILIADDLDADGEQPFNGLGHLQVYTDAINKYLQWRTKQKLGKQDEAAIAKKDYLDYVQWMKKSVRGMKAASIQLRPKGYPTID